MAEEKHGVALFLAAGEVFIALPVASIVMRGNNDLAGALRW